MRQSHGWYNTAALGKPIVKFESLQNGLCYKTTTVWFYFVYCVLSIDIISDKVDSVHDCAVNSH